jgi:protein-disulfide isomerase
MADGQKVNVSSTPTFYINGQMLVGALPYDSFKTIIDQELKK